MQGWCAFLSADSASGNEGGSDRWCCPKTPMQLKRPQNEFLLGFRTLLRLLPEMAELEAGWYEARRWRVERSRANAMS